MPKDLVPTVDAARNKRTASNVVRFPQRRGRPRGPVDPFTALRRRIANPDHAAACLARLIAESYGAKLDDAVDMARVLLTLPRHEWPEPVAWFHDWRLETGGPLRYSPTGAKVRDLLRQGRAPGLRAGNR